MTSSVEIILNGEVQPVPRECTVLELLLARKLTPESVVVELNLDIVPADDFAHRILKAGDRMEILYFVGGG
ncbi:MAG: sulfur carrier protein ThiS [Desulfovibrionaceae bacterium]